MEQKVTQRIAGVAVITALAAIFVPMMFEAPVDQPLQAEIVIPSLPQELRERFPEPPSEESIAVRTQEMVGPAERPPAATGQSSLAPKSTADRENITPSSEVPAMQPEKLTQPPSQISPEAAVAKEKASPEKLSKWIIQVGSFSDESNAKQLQKRLSTSGFRGFIDSPQGPGSKLFRVRVGPIPSKEAATRLQKKIDQTLHMSGIVMVYSE